MSSIPISKTLPIGHHKAVLMTIQDFYTALYKARNQNIDQDELTFDFLSDQGLGYRETPYFIYGINRTPMRDDTELCIEPNYNAIGKEFFEMLPIPTEQGGHIRFQNLELYTDNNNHTHIQYGIPEDLAIFGGPLALITRQHGWFKTSKPSFAFSTFQNKDDIYSSAESNCWNHYISGNTLVVIVHR